MSFMKNENIGSAILPAILLILGSIVLGWIVVFKAPVGGIAVLAVITGLFVAMMVFINYRWGIIFLLLFGVYMAHIARIADSGFPFGVPYDILALITFLSFFLSYNRNKPDWSHFSNWITYAYLLVIGFHLLQVINPLASKTAWLVSLRTFTLFMLYIVAFQYFSSFRNVRNFTLLWICVIASVALYGIYQELFGFTDFELKYIHASSQRYKQYFIGGVLRKFSFLSDPSAYGLYMACGGLSCIILAMALKKWSYKILFGILALVVLIAMSFSGTRTAYAMIAGGVGFYLLVNIRSRKTFLITLLFIGGLAVILFGPFNNWQVNRIRSTFYPSEDASMSVRDRKRLGHQDFVQSHPMGGGPFTTATNGASYTGGHMFAGFDPDSGYLEVALEQGWVGFMLYLLLITATVLRGIDSYFTIRDPVIKATIMVYLIPFFALSIAHYAQAALTTKPMDMLVVVTLALMSRAPQFKNENAEHLLK